MGWMACCSKCGNSDDKNHCISLSCTLEGRASSQVMAGDKQSSAQNRPPSFKKRPPLCCHSSFSTEQKNDKHFFFLLSSPTNFAFSLESVLLGVPSWNAFKRPSLNHWDLRGAWGSADMCCFDTGEERGGNFYLLQLGGGLEEGNGTSLIVGFAVRWVCEPCIHPWWSGVWLCIINVRHLPNKTLRSHTDRRGFQLSSLRAQTALGTSERVNTRCLE